MKRRTLLLIAAFAFFGCEKQAEGDAHAAFADVGVDELEKLAGEGKCVAVDANNDDIRAQYGVVPGALMLSSYDEYALDELPADKRTSLVFYCGYETCSAAPTAAKKAVAGGYTDVRVMKAGIRGWAKAGKKVQRP